MGSDLTNSVMRTVSFVERLEVEFPGNVLSQAMVLADVDNDSMNELIVGNIQGNIGIFKGESSQPWKKATVNGMLTCLSVGEVYLPKKNSLVCMTAEGCCYVYDVSAQDSLQSLPEDEGDHHHIKPVFTQELPANARVMCLADIDMDGQVEMVIGYSDRVVRAFQWQESHDSDPEHFVLMQKWQLEGQIGGITINYDQEQVPELMVSQPGATFVSLVVKRPFRHIHSESQLDKMGGIKQQPAYYNERRGSFASPGSTKLDLPARHNQSYQSSDLKDFLRRAKADALSGSLQNISAAKPAGAADNLSGKGAEETAAVSGNSSHMVTEVGGQEWKSGAGKLDTSFDSVDNVFAATKSGLKLSLEKLNISSTQDTHSSVEVSELSDKQRSRLSSGLDSSFDSEDAFRPSMVYHPLAHHQIRNRDTSTVIIGGINRGRLSHSSGDNKKTHTQATYYALATLDGSLILMEKEDSILWSLQVDHNLFALSKLDVTGNGKEEVVCCSWHGQTYIVNHSKEIVRYQFPDSVAAFCTGHFSLQKTNVPCFVYATFNNKIYIYHDIRLPHVESTNLIGVMAKSKETSELLAKMNIKGDDLSSVRNLYHWCLYGVTGNS